jgi:hypothetical protein
MVDPKPLFDDDETPAEPVSAPDAPRTVQVVALDLSGTDDTPAPVRPALDLSSSRPAVSASRVVTPLDLGADEPAPVAIAPEPAIALAAGESPAVAQAMRQGAQKFPDVMREYGYLVRNDLSSLLPVGFQTLSDYGSDTLTRAADLIAQVARLGEDLHELDAENLLRTIVEHANSEHGHKSLLDRLSMHGFDPQAAASQLLAIAQTIRGRLARADELADLLSRVHTTLIAQTTAVDLVSDMAELSQLGDAVTRKAKALSTSRQQVDLALRQVDTLRRQAEEWVMRADEIRTLTLPAMGFLGSL